MIRYVVLTVSLSCLTLVVANGALFEFALICIRKEAKKDPQVHSFNSYQESLLLAATAVGCILGTYPSVKLFDWIGFKDSFTVLGLASGVANIGVFVFKQNFLVLLADQLLQGASLAFCFLALGIIPSACAQYNNIGLFASILSCSLQLGPCIIMPTCGFLCSSQYGWTGAYFLFGLVTIVLFIVFFFVYDFSPNIRSSQNASLPHNNTDLHNSDGQNVPYRMIFTSASFWGIMFVAFGDTVGYQMFLLYGPIYIHKVLRFNVTNTGILTALPHLSSMVVKAAGGVVLDRSTCIDEALKVTLYISLSEALMAAGFAGLIPSSRHMASLGEALLIALTVFAGLAFVGLMSASRIIARQYTYVFTAALAIQDSLAGLFVPGIVALLAPNYEDHEWNDVFYSIVGLLIAANVMFLLMTRMRPAKWTMTQLP
ncbi:hypothetical protein QR680_010131 [Steinernema hermaphroditum]|uniref:Major facilitator superfamily (MFS) profile domain-containing protein n=1 Tax=Steinernema hermaphroditum TaxID=289476 RepID=A0AA39MA45_9BILA|nr:hypothetical protein QR680_010131 [Steinernema hermaphroditum]